VLLEAVTFTLPLPPAAPEAALPEESEKVQGVAVKLANRFRFAAAVKE
jgi:hypothetical protein